MITISVIDIDTWSSGWKVIIFAAPLAPASLGLALKIYIYNTQLNKMLAALSNSPLIQEAALRLGQKGAISRSQLIGVIHGALASSQKLIDRGWVSAADIENFPKSVKKLLSISHAISSLVVIWTALALLLIFIRGNNHW